MRKVRDAAARLDDPLSSYENGYGLKFDAHMQNTRSFPVIAQWQDGKIVTVYPPAAMIEGTRIIPLGGK